MSFFFFKAAATTEIYTLSLHDALPISHHAARRQRSPGRRARCARGLRGRRARRGRDRKSTRLNSSHVAISYAVFCLKKKKPTHQLKSLENMPKSSSKTGLMPSVSMCEL